MWITKSKNPYPNNQLYDMMGVSKFKVVPDLDAFAINYTNN